MNKHLADGHRLGNGSIGTDIKPRVDATSTISRAVLRTRVEPSVSRVYGIVYNDLHDDAVAYHLVPHAPYHSFIEGENFRIDTDAGGYPVYLRIPSVGEGILTAADLTPPSMVECGRLRFLDLRVRYQPVTIRISTSKLLVNIVFLDSDPVRHVSVGPHSIWSIDELGRLCQVWLTGIRSDPTGRRFLRWRRDAWRRVRLDSIRAQQPVPTKPTPLSAPGTGGGA